MGEAAIIGVDIAKNVFQLHGGASDGSVVFRKKLSRLQFARFMAEKPPCLLRWRPAGAHHWERAMARFGHEVRLIAPRYVKGPVNERAASVISGRPLLQSSQCNRPDRRDRGFIFAVASTSPAMAPGVLRQANP